MSSAAALFLNAHKFSYRFVSFLNSHEFSYMTQEFSATVKKAILFLNSYEFSYRVVRVQAVR